MLEPFRDGETSWIFTSKNGTKITIRTLTVDDGKALSDFFATLSPKAVQWGLPPYMEEIVARWIGNLDNLIALVAVRNELIVGYAAITKSTHPRRKAIGELAMYLRRDAHNEGIGTAMLARLIDLSKSQLLHRISLHVVADNKAAIHVYEAGGFKLEGILKDAYYGGDYKYHDELVMGLILP